MLIMGISRGLETKLKHCLAGSNIFADETPGVDPKHQVGPHQKRNLKPDVDTRGSVA